MKLNMKKVLVIMARKCMNDKELLKVSGIPFGTWNQIKTGKCTPKPATIGKIAKGLGVDPEEIID